MVSVVMAMERIKQACTETLVLSLLEGGPMHGYEMCKAIEARSAGYFSLKHSTLYPLLHKLEKRGLVVSKWAEMKSATPGKPRKYYRLTQKGTAHFKETAAQWREFFASMTRLLPAVAL